MRKAVWFAAASLAVLLCVLLFRDRAPGTANGESGPPPAPPFSAAIRGVVLDEAGAPLPGAVVTARLLEAGPSYRVIALPAGADGSFSLSARPARGVWGFWVDRPDGTRFDPEATVAASPGEDAEVTLRPPPAGAAAAGPAPNVGGFVADDTGRALAGMRVVARRPEGEGLGEGLTDPDGVFSFAAAGAPPYELAVADLPEGALSVPVPVVRSGLFDHALLVELPVPARGEMIVGVRPVVALPDTGETMAWFRLLNARGEEERNLRLPLLPGNVHFDRVPYGVYDVLVRAGEFSGIAQGFDFSPAAYAVEVEIGPGASVRARLDRPALAVLLSRSPTLVPMSLESRQEAAVLGGIRGVAARMRKAGVDVDLDGLPAGSYLLRIRGDGVETVEVPLDLAAGEVRDLGRIDLRPAAGRLTVRVFDLPGGGDREFPYLVTLFDLRGDRREAEAAAGSADEAVFAALPGGEWYLRVGRMVDGRRHLRQVGSDVRIDLAAGEERELSVDQTWRLR